MRPSEGRASRPAFFPVIHLLTGPPGLRRNGGIWKAVKRNLTGVSDAARVMVQCLHFTSYNLSHGAWDDWFAPYYDSTRLSRELDETFGKGRDVFVDSGGFQLLNGDKLDLSKWDLKVEREDILELQLKYRPQRIASLDRPLGPKITKKTFDKNTQASIANAAWLTNQDLPKGTKAYAVVHGRTPEEISDYLEKLQKALPRNWLRKEDVGLALGSQVPLAKNPLSVLANARTVLAWMDKNASAEVGFHGFGVGEAVVGALQREQETAREISFDNSSWVQKAFRMEVYHPEAHGWVDYDPKSPVPCSCAACTTLQDFGGQFVHDLMTKPAYRPSANENGNVNRSDILGLMGLHNLHWWQDRLNAPLRGRKGEAVVVTMKAKERYDFPLQKFEPRAEHLLMLPCSKERPYQTSRSHKALLTGLAEEGLKEGRDFDRITLSGMYGPVHWSHETHPSILSYDFQLGKLVSVEHRDQLKLRTANVFNVIGKRYDNCVAFLRNKPYRDVFGPIVEQFGSTITQDPDEVAALLTD